MKTFPDSGNGGSGSLIGNGTASCTPAGCDFSEAGPDIEYELTNDLTCTSDPDGIYGGVEDSFAIFGVINESGGPVALDLRLSSDWSIAASTTDPLSESADASVLIAFPVPAVWCIELTACPDGSLSGGTSSAACPSGSLLGASLFLASSEVDTAMGNDAESRPSSNCDLTLTIPNVEDTGYSSTPAITSTCSSMSCSLLTLSSDTVMDPLTKESCQIEAGNNYAVAGPNGNLTLRAGLEIRLFDGFSVGVDGQLTLELDPGLAP